MLILKPGCPPESSDRLVNPERGFLALFKARLTPWAQDMKSLTDGIHSPDGDDLLLCEVNLNQFYDCPINSEGLRQLDELLSSLKARGGSLILRFLYDWDGKGLSAEPRMIETILGHIRQAGTIVREYSDAIFLHQGLFTGSWGEMHGTRYSSVSDMSRLLMAQRDAFGPGMTLCVRTIGQLQSLEALPGCSKSIGLYNDGMMGSESDLGSYASDGYKADREEALKLQSRICLHVPNGGEAVYNARYSAFPEALRSLRLMRVSYLNRFHDTRALKLWSDTHILTPGIWHGMNGFDYIERHLGYRYVIRDVSMDKALFKNKIQVKAVIENIGFAPAYHKLSPRLTLCLKDAPDRTSYMIDDVSCTCAADASGDGKICRGAGAARGTLTVTAYITLSGLAAGSWRLYLTLWSDKYGREVYMGNEGREDPGYPIGGFDITWYQISGTSPYS
jgi:hypothetical protein